MVEESFGEESLHVRLERGLLSWQQVRQSVGGPGVPQTPILVPRCSGSVQYFVAGESDYPFGCIEL